MNANHLQSVTRRQKKKKAVQPEARQAGEQRDGPVAGGVAALFELFVAQNLHAQQLPVEADGAVPLRHLEHPVQRPWHHWLNSLTPRQTG